MSGEKVWLSRCGGYRPEELLAQVEEAFAALGVWEELKPGMQVVLKPNLVISAKPEAAIATHPGLVAAVGRCVQKAGGQVIIAESPGGPYTPAAMKAVFRGCGYTEMAKEWGFTLYTDCKSREVSLPGAVRCRQLSVAEPFLTRDYLIDLAKLKTHGMVGFSGAVKNLFGAVPGLQKPELHCRFPEKQAFSEMLVDLCDFLKPDLCFTDGILAMEGGETVGVLYSVNVSGYGGTVEILVGFGIEAKEITGVKVLNQSETPGLGANCTNAWFSERYIGKTAEQDLTVVKVETSSPAEVQAITAATITSAAITDGVNAARQDFAASYGSL